MLILSWIWQAATQIDWVTLSRLLPEVALVLIFVWFTLERDRRAGETESKMNAQRIQERLDRDKDWRDFLREERAMRDVSLARLSEKIDQISQSVTAGNALLMQHDSWEHLAYQGLGKKESG